MYFFTKMQFEIHLHNLEFAFLQGVNKIQPRGQESSATIEESPDRSGRKNVVPPAYIKRFCDNSLSKQSGFLVGMLLTGNLQPLSMMMRSYS